MRAQSTRRRNAGFTVIEVIIAASLGAVLLALLYTPTVNGIIMAQRENAELEMFRSADILLSRLTSHLQPAVLPITFSGANHLISNGGGNRSQFRYRVNSARYGFGTFGKEWRRVLQGGTDFLPYCTPIKNNYMAWSKYIPFSYEHLTLLGIFDIAGHGQTSAEYVDNAHFMITDEHLNRSLAGLDPEDYDLSGGSAATVDLDNLRFDEKMDFVYQKPATSPFNRGFAVARFVPLREGRTPAPVILREAVLNADLNHDNDKTDEFARGSLRITYGTNVNSTNTRPEEYVEFPVPEGMVLLQLNRNDPGYVPLFQLVGGYGRHGDSPSGLRWDGKSSGGSEQHALLVRVLLFDRVQEGRVLAFGQDDGRQFITKQFQTTIALRNMSIE